MSNTKTWLEFAFYTQNKLENPKRFKQLGLSWKSTEKRILSEIRLIEPRADLFFCRVPIQPKLYLNVLGFK